MLTGRVPFTGESAHSVMYRQVHEPPPPPGTLRPDLRGPVEAAVAACPKRALTLEA
jgi:hypothetical protein